MYGEELSRLMEKNPPIKPVLVVPYREKGKISSKTIVEGLDSLCDDDGLLTSLSGLVRHCSLLDDDTTFLVKTSCVDSGNSVEGDVDPDCNFNNRMGACYREASGYVSSAFTDGTYMGVAVSNSCRLPALLDKDMEEAASVIFLADMMDILGKPLEEPFRMLCMDNGYDPRRAADEPVWGHGSVCGSVGLRADLSLGRLDTRWMKRDEHERPPFLSSRDIQAIREGVGVEYMKTRGILCGPVCLGAISKGLRHCDRFLVEPCSDVTVVINATVKGATDVLGRLCP